MPARLVAAVAVLLAAGPALAADFVGPESCRVCHLAAYDAWKQGPHAKAMASLSPSEQKDGTCLACHAPDVPKGGDAAVTCETCHGAGRYYTPDYVMKDAELARAAGLVVPDEKSCVLCHDAMSPSLQPFDPATKLPLVDHWSAERAARKAKGDKAEACPRPKAGKLAKARPPGRDFLTQVLAAPVRKDAARPAVRLAQAR